MAYALKKAWRDGSTHVVLEPDVLIERLLALVPRPRRHLVTYHGVLAPASSVRPRIAPRVDEVDSEGQQNVECALLEEGGSEPSEAEALPRRPRWLKTRPFQRADCPRVGRHTHLRLLLSGSTHDGHTASGRGADGRSEARPLTVLSGVKTIRA